MDAATTRELDLLARTASEAADAFTPDRSEKEYERLREQAAALNSVHGWAERDGFDTMFPTLTAQRQIESLDMQLGVEQARAGHDDEPIQRLLRNLASWAIGISLARKELGIWEGEP